MDDKKPPIAARARAALETAGSSSENIASSPAAADQRGSRERPGLGAVEAPKTPNVRLNTGPLARQRS